MTRTGIRWSRACPLTGMAKQLAQHCELSERSESTHPLAPVAGAQVPARQGRSRKSCRPSCRPITAGALRLEIDLAEVASETPAERSRNAQRERQDRAIAAIEQDPFVREVVDLFDASIDESTIKPV